MKGLIIILTFTQAGLTCPQSIQTTKDLVSFLQFHGYAEGYEERSEMSPQETQTALKRFQEFYGLPVTGLLDELTKGEMEQERCGVSDLRNPRFTLDGRRWARDLTWKLNTNHPSISNDDARRVISNAIREWTSKMDLGIIESRTSSADIVFDFASSDEDGNHGDGVPFQPRTLAHAFYPAASSIAGDVHVNVKFSFSITEPPLASRHSLLTILVHELGHSLGLKHSSVRNSIMYPTIRRGDAYQRLQVDDIQGIQALYGVNVINGTENAHLHWITLAASLLKFFIKIINICRI